jgi:hypothetical protein
MAEQALLLAEQVAAATGSGSSRAVLAERLRLAEAAAAQARMDLEAATQAALAVDD